jgi:hypothetical protein
LTKLPDGRVVPLKVSRAEVGFEAGQVLDGGGQLVAQIVPVKAPGALVRQKQAQFQATAQKFLSQIMADPEFEAKRVWVHPPIFPRPDLWEEFKDAQLKQDIQRVAHEIARWMRRFAHPRWSRELKKHAADLLEAKKTLWTYPGSARPSSDNKRAEFFGKALAGLVLGVSPATSARKLSHWSPLKTTLTPAPPPTSTRAALSTLRS